MNPILTNHAPARGIHGPSLLGGVALSAALALGIAAASPQSKSNVLGASPFAWRNLVRIEENYPYTVPPGSTLVLQSSGYTVKGSSTPGNTSGAPLQVEIDGQLMLLLNPVGGPSSITPGWAVQSGARVNVRFSDDETVGYVFGYLVAD